MLEWHGHNDFYKAVVNAAAAWLYGASAVNCSLLGIGERTGNIPLEAMVIEYASLRGTFDGMDPTVITEIAEYYRHELGYNIPPMTPFVGESFNVTKAGIHADGLMKDAEIYNIFNTEKILNRPAEVAISNTSGLAGIAYWINTHFRLTPEEMLTKQDPLILSMKEKIDGQYTDGRTTVMSEEELLEIIDTLAPGAFRSRKGSLWEIDYDYQQRHCLSEERVYTALEEAILSGELKKGEALTELGVSEKLGVSRTPVRGALHRLAEEGLIEVSPNRVAVVVGVTTDDLIDIYRIRMRLEGLAAAMAAVKMSPEGKRALSESVDLSEFYLQKQDPEHLKELDTTFHGEIYRACGSRILCKICRSCTGTSKHTESFPLPFPDGLKNP